MDAIEQQQEEEAMMEAPEIDCDLLVELLDSSLAGEVEGGQLGFTADLDDGDCWADSQALNCSIHPHHDCEDCGLDGILSDLEGFGSPRPRSPAPYGVLDDEDPEGWAETDAFTGPFTGECMGEWYMDGMAMEWDEEDTVGGFSLEPSYGEEAGTEQVYGSQLWE